MGPTSPPNNSQGPNSQDRKTAGTSGAFSIFGVPVRLHFTFVLLFIFVVAVALSGNVSAAFMGLYLLFLFSSVLLHELGHALVSKRFGIRTVEIVMYPIGGVARMERSPEPGPEFWIAIAGPAVNLVIAAAILFPLHFLGKLVPPDQLRTPTDANILQLAGLGNLWLALFNLLPAFPMDGGRILRALLARSRPIEKATQTAAQAGQMLAIAMGLFGLLSANFLLVFIALFVWLGAAQEHAEVVGRTLTHGIPVRAAMVTEFHTLAHGQSVREAANLLLATSQQDFPVVLGEQVIGLLGRNALLRGMAMEGPDAYVASIMDRDFKMVSPETDLAEAMPVLAQAGTCALVMEEGQLVGLLTRENLSEFLLLRRFGMAVPEAPVQS
jgi:Zn-dependent protease/CBS domain-containing protein